MKFELTRNRKDSENKAVETFKTCQILLRNLLIPPPDTRTQPEGCLISKKKIQKRKLLEKSLRTSRPRGSPGWGRPKVACLPRFQSNYGVLRPESLKHRGRQASLLGS